MPKTYHLFDYELREGKRRIIIISSLDTTKTSVHDNATAVYTRTQAAGTMLLDLCYDKDSYLFVVDVCKLELNRLSTSDWMGSLVTNSYKFPRNAIKEIA